MIRKPTHHRWILSTLALILLGVARASASPEIHFAADLAQGFAEQRYEPTDPRPHGFASLTGGKTLFVETSHAGAEVWVTDGSISGTRMVADLCPGPCSFAPEVLGSSGSDGYFLAQSAADVSQRELWRTDGTLGGTRRILPGNSLATVIQFIGPLPGSTRVYFTVCSTGCGLWRTDGTVGGTVRVTGVGDATARNLLARAVVGRLAFLKVGGPSAALWVSDGTIAGTRRLSDTANDPHLTAVGSRVYFNGAFAASPLAGWRPVTSDGSPKGTVLLHDQARTSGAFVRVGKGVCFRALEVQTGSEVWCSEGTRSTTRRISNFGYYAAIDGDPEFPVPIVGLKGRVYFLATDGIHPTGIWSADGTPTGTRPFEGCPGGCPDEVSELAVINDKLLFVGAQDDGEYIKRLYASDGTGAGTVILPVACESYVCEWLYGAPGFSGRFAFFGAFNDTAASLFRTDGTVAGTIRLLASQQGFVEFTAVPRGPASWWIASNADDIARLATTNGTRSGTRALRRRDRFERSSSPEAVAPLGSGAVYCARQDGGDYNDSMWYSSGPATAVRIDDYHCDVARGVGTSGGVFWVDTFREGLWYTDGTAAGTLLLSGGYHLNLRILGPWRVGTEVVFAVGQGFEGPWALHRSDGTVAGTRKLLDLADEPYLFSVTGSTAYFVAANKLWRSDLNEGSSAQVLGDAPNAGFEGSIQRHGSVVLVEGERRIHWLRDNGSTLLLPLAPTTDFERTRGLFIHQGIAYFWGSALGGTTERLARLDLAVLEASGSASVTVLRAFNLPPENSIRDIRGRFARLADGRLAFAARDAVGGAELFVTDGTTVGTQRVVDLFPGPMGSLFTDPFALSGGVVFAAHDSLHGIELWSSDGTEAGTQIIEDLWPGPESSSPGSFVEAAGRLFFAGNDGKVGHELWVLETD